MKLLRQLLILLLTIVLPVQGIAGVSMSMCSMDMSMCSMETSQSAFMPHESMTVSCHHHATESVADDAVQSPDSCPHCFALAHFIAAPTRVFLHEPMPDDLILAPSQPFSSHISLPLLRPPLSL
jgi:hypothetical protein